MNIDKIKDNQIVKDNGYVDSELLRDNFDGSDEHLKIIAKTIYECVDASNEDDSTFMDECISMAQCDYDYLKTYQTDEVLKLVDELCCNNGEFKGEL